jgi:hypothetical protein
VERGRRIAIAPEENGRRDACPHGRGRGDRQPRPSHVSSRNWNRPMSSEMRDITV